MYEDTVFVINRPIYTITNIPESRYLSQDASHNPVTWIEYSEVF